MRDFYFTFRSMTKAQQATILLLQYGIDADFTRTPKRVSDMGCGYATRVRQEDAYRSSLVLRQEGVYYERGVCDAGWTVDDR